MTPKNHDKEFRAGLAFSLAAFGFWALVQPYFFGAFEETDALIIMAHRTLWSCVFIWVWLTLRGKLWSALKIFRDLRKLAILALTGCLIASNWGVYIFAVQQERLLDASVGYFMTPLMTAAFGIVVLGERPRKLQIWALSFAIFGVVSYIISIGQAPFTALYLSLSFSAYGGIRKMLAVPAERGMAVETLLIAPLALGLIFAFGWAGSPYGIASTLRETLFLLAAGLVTLLPLVWYNAAAARLPLLSLGLLQFIVPIGLFTLSLLPPLNESLDLAKSILFGFIWIGLGFYVWDLVSSARKSSVENSPSD